MLLLAFQEGGIKLDAFDTVLPPFYARVGFVATGRLELNDAGLTKLTKFSTPPFGPGSEMRVG